MLHKLSGVYRCDYTEQLRAQANISDPVTLVSEETDTPSQLISCGQGHLTNQESEERNHWQELDKEELISVVEKLTENDSRKNIIIKFQQEDLDLMIQNRKVFASAFRLANRLEQRFSTFLPLRNP